jgi:ribosome-associated translation inhibitor RaiA
MIKIKFKNLEKSQIALDAVNERVDTLIEKFPDLAESKLQVTLEMENSPKQAGPDFFKVKLHVSRGRYDGVTIEKSNSNLYVALADMVDHLLESLNRFGDKIRVKERKKARKISREIKQLGDVFEQGLALVK